MRGILRSNDVFRCVNTGVFDAVAAASASGEYDVTVLFEYNPAGKVRNVDPKATPYRRDLPGNALALISNWKTAKETDEIRKLALDLCDQVKEPTTDLAYGNYSAFGGMLRCAHRSLTRQHLHRPRQRGFEDGWVSFPQQGAGALPRALSEVARDQAQIRPRRHLQQVVRH